MIRVNLYLLSPKFFYKWINIFFSSAFILFWLFCLFNLRDVYRMIIAALFLVNMTVFLFISVISLFFPKKHSVMFVSGDDIFIDHPQGNSDLGDINKIIFEKKYPITNFEQEVCTWGAEVYLKNGDVYYMKTLHRNTVNKLISIGRQKIGYRDCSSLQIPFTKFLSNFSIDM
ncbi:hypothetical protein [Hymenobacter sp. DG25B]|uniref:hypothetical protein n=1 Tax=Hymenobacter sp. DG25B TaxID=1385664 RepID=UPI0012E08765|nr:hypothetical protein [Hymenobacter sp. DG25B]